MKIIKKLTFFLTITFAMLFFASPVKASHCNVYFSGTTVNAGASTTFTGTAVPSGSGIAGLTFVSSKPSIISVNPGSLTVNAGAGVTYPFSAQITGVAGGSASISVTATMADGKTCSTSHTFYVRSCSMSLNSATIRVGDTVTLTAKATTTYDSVSRVSITSDNPSIASLAPDRFNTWNVKIATGISTGVANITASATTDTGRMNCSTTSTVTVVACHIDLTPSTATIGVGSSQLFTATAVLANAWGVIQDGMSSSNTSVASLTPVYVSEKVFTYLVTALKRGTSTITANANINSGGACNGASALVTVSNIAPTPSPTPTGPPAPHNFFDLPGDQITKGDANGYPGVPAYGGSTNLTQTNVSQTGWLANSGYDVSKVYNSGFYLNSIPDNIIPQQIPVNSEDGDYFLTGGSADTQQYIWYEYDGATGGSPFTINTPANIAGRKVILIVKNADIYLKGNITRTIGSGFFMVITTGNIIVDPSVTGLAGIYVADGLFETGTTGAQNDSQLLVQGSVAAYGGFNLQRDLGGAANSLAPAELFEYEPDLEILYPASLGVHSMNWQEVAP